MKTKNSTIKSKTQGPVALPETKTLSSEDVEFADENIDGRTIDMPMECNDDIDDRIEAALQAKDYSTYLLLHSNFPIRALLNRKNRLDAFVDIHRELTPEQFWQLLIEVWIYEKIIFRDFDLWMALLEVHPPPPNEDLPETITVYRGCNGQTGLSWSLSKSVAQKFADAIDDGVVVQGTVRRENIYFYTNEREEQEVVVDPDFVEDQVIIAGPS